MRVIIITGLFCFSYLGAVMNNKNKKQRIKKIKFKIIHVFKKYVMEL